MYYPDELVEEIRAANDIVDIVSGYVRLQKKGAGYFGLCPFHNEKSPSFSVSPTKQMFYCFGCGAGGNVYTFLMNYENYSFQEAVKSLADKAGISLPEAEYSAEAKKEADRKSLLLAINKEAARYFYYQLRHPRGRTGLAYLQKRGLTDEIMHRFGLGYADKTGGDLTNYLKSKGYRDKEIIDAGLASADEKHGIHNKFWNRVMFPISDVNHRVIGFGGRVMGEGNPKYLNSPETSVFDKSRNLYGLNFARTARKNHLILCEGYMDVIALHQAGFPQAVASLGTAFTSGQAGLVRRYASQVLLAYDSDDAGVNAALRALDILRQTDLTGKVIDLHPFKDPDELIRQEGAEEFQRRIDGAENGFLFEIRMLERQFSLEDPEERTRFHREIAARMCRFEEAAQRENYIQTIAHKYAIGFENLRSLVNGHAMKTGLTQPLQPVTRTGMNRGGRQKAEDAGRKAQRLMLTYLAEEPGLYEKLRPWLSPEDFTEEFCRKVADQLFRDLSRGKMSPADIISLFREEEEQRAAAELFNTKLAEAETKQEREKAVHDVLVTVKQNSLAYYTARLGSETSALNQVISGKKALEELKKTHISLW
ncbi:MAG: DNA primase [Lachnospiraceae bacterium]|nr:DNA primase [Lachnospiraceae bacterium]